MDVVSFQHFGQFVTDEFFYSGLAKDVTGHSKGGIFSNTIAVKDKPQLFGIVYHSEFDNVPKSLLGILW